MDEEDRALFRAGVIITLIGLALCAFLIFMIGCRELARRIPMHEEACTQLISDVCWRVDECSERKIKQNQCVSYLRDHGLCMFADQEEFDRFQTCRNLLWMSSCEEFREIVERKRRTICDPFIERAGL